MSALAASVRFVRLPRFAAALLAGLPLLAGAARADQITTTLNGKVTAIVPSGTNPNTVSQLAAKGVHIGDAVTGKIVIESSTVGHTVQSTPYDYEQYDVAIVDLVLSVGTWNAHLAPPPGLESLNFVQVADNVTSNGNGPQFDSWSGTALGDDTAGILTAGSDPEFGDFFLLFSNIPPNASSNEGLVQDLSKYKSAASISFAGSGGGITFSFNTTGGGKTVDPTALARQGQLKAAATLGNSVLKGLGKLAAAPPDKDPLGTAKDALLLKASDTFGTQFLAAISKAAKKGGTAPLGESGKQAATKFLMGGLQTQSDAITDGVDTSNAADRALRGALLKALAAECHSDFIAHSNDAKKPDADKLAKALAKSRAKLVAAVGKALDKAAKKGVSYAGPDAQGLADALAPFVDGFVDLTSTGVE